MSISLVTRGRLWPVGSCKVIREQFTDIHVSMVDPQSVTSEVSDVTEIRFSVAVDDMPSVKIEVEDGVTLSVSDTTSVDTDIGEC